MSGIRVHRAETVYQGLEEEPSTKVSSQHLNYKIPNFCEGLDFIWDLTLAPHPQTVGVS